MVLLSTSLGKPGGGGWWRVRASCGEEGLDQELLGWGWFVGEPGPRVMLSTQVAQLRVGGGSASVGYAVWFVWGRD